MPFMPAVKGNGMAGENFPHQVAERTPACSDQEMDMLCEVPDYVKLIQPPLLYSRPLQSFSTIGRYITTHNSVQ